MYVLRRQLQLMATAQSRPFPLSGFLPHVSRRLSVVVYIAVDLWRTGRSLLN